ncbi:MAG: hypothetical protein GH151_13315 [Bacteroidetes bacterium]|nr:hypothetical protein [Bacteroidota bacterium]
MISERGGKGSFLIAGRRSYTDIIQSGLYKDIFNMYNKSPETPAGLGGGSLPGLRQNQPFIFMT